MMIIAEPHPDSSNLLTLADRWCLAAEKDLAAQSSPPSAIVNYHCKISGFISGRLVFTAFTSAEENARLWLPFTSGRTSPPCHAESPPFHLPQDTLQIPPSPLLPLSYLHIPYTTLQVSGFPHYTARLCCLIFSIARCLYNINNPGPDDGNKVQSVEVRRVRAGFDLHNLLQTPAQPSQTPQITWFGEPD